MGDNVRALVRPAHPFEVDQVADVCLVVSSSGVKYAFWSANDNTYGNGHIMGAALEPSPMQYQNGSWVPISKSSAPGGALAWPFLGKNVVGSTFTDTTAGGVAVPITGLGFGTISMPNSSRITVNVMVRAKTSVAGKLAVTVNMANVTALQGYTSATCAYDDMPANTYRSFFVPLTFDVSQGRTFAINVLIVNSQVAGTTTTVEAGNGSQISIDQRNL
jgi:hypothetical protein